jgi:hypothetical protein
VLAKGPDRQVISSVGGTLTSSRKVAVLENLDDYGQAFNVFLQSFIKNLPRDPRVADRLEHPARLRNLARAFTVRSVLEYDRQFRQQNPGGLWTNEINKFLQHLLVEHGTSKKGGDRASPSKGAGQAAAKQAAALAKKKKGKGICHAAQAGEVCKWGADCRYS